MTQTLDGFKGALNSIASRSLCASKMDGVCETDLERYYYRRVGIREAAVNMLTPKEYAKLATYDESLIYR